MTTPQTGDGRMRRVVGIEPGSEIDATGKHVEVFCLIDWTTGEQIGSALDTETEARARAKKRGWTVRRLTEEALLEMRPRPDATEEA